ncbi:MAG: two-component regulator propeller domain-containing protein [Bacteroidota bacterium]
MHNIWKWSLIVWMSGMVLNVFGQQMVTFRELSKKDGLSQASVFAIAQDSTGFMWFGTRDGLNKYDGYQFKVFKKSEAPNSIVANDIRTLYFDPQEKDLWIGTNAGLSKYQSKTDDFLNYLHDPADSNSLSNNVIRQIYRDSKGRLWVGTDIGLNLLDEEQNHFKRFLLGSYSAEDRKGNDVKALLEDRNGNLCLGTADGLYLLREQNNPYTFERIDEKAKWQLSDTHIKTILEDQKGNFWIGTFEGGINYWDKEKESITVYQNEKNNPYSLSHNNIRSMCLDEADNLWVGTFDGLNFLEKDQQAFKRYTKSDFGQAGLSDKSIRSVFIDQQGSLWVGTYYGGINHLDENYNRFINFKYAPVGNSLSGNVVSSFAEDQAGNLWIGTEGDGLNFYNTTTKKFQSYQWQQGEENTISGNNVKQLLLDGDYLWIGTFQAGLNLLDIGKQQFRHFKNDPQNQNSLSANNVYGLLKEGNFLWILTYGGGLDILDLEKNKFYNYKRQSNDNQSLSSDNGRVLLKTTNGQLWIGTERGLNKVTKDKAGFPERFEVYLAQEKIYSLQEDVHHNIWVGTFTNGLYCFNPKTESLVHYTTAEGLPGNIVFGILEVSEEELWLSTNNGLSKFNPQVKTFTNYGYSNGLENSEYNFNAYFKTTAGDLLFGGINGFTQFNPAVIQPNQFIPPIAFTELRKNNQVVKVGDKTHLLSQSINDTKQLTFKYNEANFTLSFAALDYVSAAYNHHAYMLEGIDRDWNYSVGATQAIYTIQREGEYIFKMKGGNSDGLWNPAERQLKIIVLPPPWRTWWAYLIYLGLLSGFTFALVRFIRLRHKLQLEQIAKQQQEELHEVKLRFFTNITHEFRTPLTLILGPLKELISKEKHAASVTKQLSLIERNTQRLLNLVNQVLTFRKLATDHEPLKIVHGNIVEFLQELFLPFQESATLQNIDYQFKTEDKRIEAWFDQDKLEKVFFNLLSNAFKFTPENGRIAMSIFQHAQYIEVRVEDNGVGIEPEYQDQIFKRFYEKSDSKRSTIKGTGIGLAISKQMVELHQGKIFVENNTRSRGATFVVQIPKGKAHFGEMALLEHSGLNGATEDYQGLIVPKQDDPSLTLPAEKTLTDASPMLLIVEDNQEVQSYIQQIFASEYRVVTAENGREGLEKARKHLPNLIISDVMMPEMDGITFCRTLKSDLEISHIPILLLTARTAALFKIEGLKTGADDYVTKPFNPEELRLRVRNIIQARKEAREKFARVLSLDPKEISVTSADEVFLEKALQVVEKQMDNPNFSVVQFASELAISRPLLFTKLKALTGQTPNNFIKTIRLKRAAQLLKTKKLNVSEVAYKVGFKDPKYFRKCFKEQFEVPPSVY